MPDLQSNHDKVALITGANRGIGWETARELGELGIQVVLGSRDLRQGEEAVAKLQGMGIRAEAVPLEMTNPR